MAWLTVERYAEIRARVAAAGHAAEIRWAQALSPPADSRDFALEAIYVICCSGMKAQIAQRIMARVEAALEAGRAVDTAFRNTAKVRAIEEIWGRRDAYFRAYLSASDKLAYCETLPHIGKVTKYHLAKNFGLDVAKPDIWLERLAAVEGLPSVTGPGLLCARLARESGDRVATVDTVLWRACNLGILVVDAAARSMRLGGAAEAAQGAGSEEEGGTCRA